MNGFVEYQERIGMSRNTITARVYDMKSFFDKMERFDNDSVNEYVLDIINKFDPKTVHRKVQSLRAYAKYKKVFVNIEHRLPAPKRKTPNFLTSSEMSSCISSIIALNKTLDQMAVRTAFILFNYGLRRSEVINLKMDNVDINNSRITFTAKGNKDRIVPMYFLKDELVEYYNRRRELEVAGDPFIVFTGREKYTGVYKYRKPELYDLYKFLYKYTEPVFGRKINPHAYRHTFATHLLNNGVDVRNVQEVLGHENINTTMLYTHVATSKLESEVKRAHIYA